jgi:hypothetical protein
MTSAVWGFGGGAKRWRLKAVPGQVDGEPDHGEIGLKLCSEAERNVKGSTSPGARE